MAERPLGLISVDELVRVLPDLIADALRERDTRPPPASQATLTKATGVVTTAGTTTAEVQLDDDEPGVISQVQLASAVAAGDRVVVLLSPGGSAIAIGSGSAQTAVPLLIGPGDPNGVVTAPEGWLYEQNDAPELWQNTDGGSAWELVGSAGLPIINDDGTYTQTIEDDAGRLRLENRLNAGSVLLSELIFDTDGTAYFISRDGEVVVSSFGGAIQQARLDAGSGEAWASAESSSGIKTAGLHLDSSLVAEVDDGTWSQPTFRVGRASTGWATLFQTLTTMPPDGDLTASDFAFRFDDTPGSAKFEIKGKNSAGTVVTGSIALT